MANSYGTWTKDERNAAQQPWTEGRSNKALVGIDRHEEALEAFMDPDNPGNPYDLPAGSKIGGVEPAAAPREQLTLNIATGDPHVQFQIGGTPKFTLGVDDSDGDQLKFGTTGLTSSTFLRTDGAKVTLGADVDAAATLHISTADSGVSPAANQDDLLVENADHAGITIGAPNDKTAALNFADPDDNDVGRVIYDHASDHMAFVANAAERVRIDADGKVGIGTSAPSHMLQVNGDAMCGGWVWKYGGSFTNTSTWTDRVSVDRRASLMMFRVYETNSAHNGGYLVFAGGNDYNASHAPGAASYSVSVLASFGVGGYGFGDLSFQISNATSGKQLQVKSNNANNGTVYWWYCDFVTF